MGALLFGWDLLVTAITLCFAICIVLIVAQFTAFKWYSQSKGGNNIFSKEKKEHFCLYGTYIMAAICSVQCLLNHISYGVPPYFCIYGMIICVIFHEAAKTFGYYFFLERAKAAILLTKSDILPLVVTKYILPTYILLYFCVYCVLCPLTVRGSGVSIESKSTPTACLFDRYHSWIFYVSVGVEVFNSIFFVFLFIYPLYKLRIVKSEHVEVIKIIKYNIIFSSISCISSVAFLVYSAFAINGPLSHSKWLLHYFWHFVLMINELCIFMMVAENRKYLYFKLFSKNVEVDPDEEETSNSVETTKIRSMRIANKNNRKLELQLEQRSLIEMNSLAEKQKQSVFCSQILYGKPKTNSEATIIDSSDAANMPLPNLFGRKSPTPVDTSRSIPYLSSRF